MIGIPNVQFNFLSEWFQIVALKCGYIFSTAATIWNYWSPKHIM